ncbi:septum formation family protein [Nocardia yamanashiensis]|uniref:septum formation family protein n=1 Tax=Nocardia yamanashiensis TaxID=209247 RepID=UPI0012FE059A|nr:septum formation family protein [Nocardia yamanashiensis]
MHPDDSSARSIRTASSANASNPQRRTAFRMAALFITVIAVGAPLAIGVIALSDDTSSTRETDPAQATYSIPSNLPLLTTIPQPVTIPGTSATTAPLTPFTWPLTTHRSPTGFTLIRNLQTGDCVDGNLKKGESATGMTVVACTKPHDAEVATVIYLPSWDSKESVDDYIQTTCGEQLDPILRAHPELTWAYYYPPSKADWQQDSKVQCLLHDGNDAKLTGKLTK